MAYQFAYIQYLNRLVLCVFGLMWSPYTSVNKPIVNTDINNCVFYKCKYKCKITPNAVFTSVKTTLENVKISMIFPQPNS